MPSIFDLTGQVSDGVAFFIPDPMQGNLLFLQFKDVLSRTSIYQIQCKGKSGKYEWLYNGNPVSTNEINPTIITFDEYNTNTFTIKKAPAPEPITDFTVKGQVVDPDKNPVPNATVGYFNSDVDIDTDDPLITTLTDADGNFVLEGCYTRAKDPEDLHLTYMAKNYANVDVWSSFSL